MYFIAKIVLSYDGYEWTDQALIKADTRAKANKKIKGIDFTHNNGSETQEVYTLIELREEEYIILKRYL